MLQDLIYCKELECQEPIKIIESTEHAYEEHNGHKTNKISKLRAELLEMDNDTNPLRVQSLDAKELLIIFIDDQINSLTKLFHETMLDFGKKLKQYRSYFKI